MEFTKEDLKLIKSGIGKSIKHYTDLYAARVKKMDEADPEIGYCPANMNSLDSISGRISELRLLYKKIGEEIRR